MAISMLEQALYQEAKIRLSTRIIDGRDFIANSGESFIDGLRFGQAINGPNDLHAHFDILLEKIKSETNEGFAIVCALLAKVEAVKGKGYQASWQKRGMAGALAN